MGFIRKTIDFYERIAERYSGERNDISVIKKEIEQFIKFLKGNEILDVGCGPGRDSKYFAKKGLNSIGIDLSENFLRIARKNSPKTKFMKMDMRKLNFADENFDGLWICSSFLHIPKKDNEKTLKEFYRVLKKGGIMFIAAKMGEGEKIKDGSYIAFYSQKEFELIIKGVGFHIKKSYINEHKNKWIIVFATK